MPKDEFDFEDPLELNGVAFLTQEDTTDDMGECFAEEFLRMGYGDKQIFALFRNPHYVGPHMVYERRGEPFVRDLIAEVFARWGRPVSWATSGAPPPHESHVSEPNVAAVDAAMGQEETLTDPMGAPIPKLNV